MKNRILSFIQNNPLVIALLGITVLLSYLNYTPGTFLTGWDTLQHELNFGLNFKRQIFGVWREYQGLGAVAGHSHTSDLPRQIFLWLESFILPLNFLRYSYIFLTLIIGPLGVYYFVNQALLKDQSKPQRQLAAFAGAIIYLMNLGTVQLFYVPFEMFAAAFAFVPWLFAFVSKYLESGKQRDLLWFVVFTVLGLPMAYAASLWYAYFGGLTLFLATLVIAKRQHTTLVWYTKTKRTGVLLLATLLINAYWLLPNIYFIVNHGAQVTNAHINKVFSQEAFLYNQKYGNWQDVSLLRSFLFDWNVYNYQTKSFQPLLFAWRNHLANPWIQIIGYDIFALAVLGIWQAFKQKNLYFWGLLAVLALSLFMIIGENPPTGFIFKALYEQFGFLKEGFRFVFNKFAILAMFALAGFGALGWSALLGRFEPIKIKKFATVGLLGLLSIYFMPAFKGELIGKSMRVDIPQEYFKMFEWFDNQKDNGRVAKLPIHSFAGWTYYDWGYQGAGFVWFGIQQPVLDRDFDRWSPYNEQYYNEMSHAIYARDVENVEAVLEKYEIRWILLDKNVIEPGTAPESLYYPETEALFAKSDHITLAQKFGDILVYTVDLNGSDGDNANFLETGAAQQVSTLEAADYHPFDNFNDGSIKINYQEEKGYTFETAIPAQGAIDFPRWQKNYAYPEINVVVNKASSSRTLQVTVPELNGELGKEYVMMPNRDSQRKLALEPRNCESNLRRSNISTSEKSAKFSFGGKYLEYSATDSSSCDSFGFWELEHGKGYLLDLEQRNVEGLPLYVCISNYYSAKCDLRTRIPDSSQWTNTILMQLPMNPDDKGYGVSIDTISIGERTSTNQLREVRMQPFPYEWLKGITVNRRGRETVLGEVKILQSTHPNPVYYTATVKVKDYPGVLTLNQSYEDGWVLVGAGETQHLKVNNWANGWVLPPGTHKVKIFFWPQLLQWVGMVGLVAVVMLYLTHDPQGD